MKVKRRRENRQGYNFHNFLGLCIDQGSEKVDGVNTTESWGGRGISLVLIGDTFRENFAFRFIEL